MTKKVKNDVTADSFCVPPYHSDGKYNSTFEERIKRTPKENAIRGMWTGNRGESWYIPATEENLGIYRQTKA